MNRRSFLRFLGIAAPAAAVVARAGAAPEVKPPHPVAFVKRTLGSFTSPEGNEMTIHEHVIRLSDGTEIDKFIGVPPGLPYVEEGPSADSAAKLAETKAKIEAHYAKQGVEPQRIDWREIRRSGNA